MAEEKRLTLYDRITLGVEAMVPLVRAMRRELGQEKADAIVRQALREIDLEIGRQEAARRKPTGQGMAKGVAAYAAGEALDYEVLQADEAGLAFDVKRCGYAQFMEKIGARDLGALLICERDFAVAEGMGVELERKATIMGGAGCCSGEGDGPRARTVTPSAGGGGTRPGRPGRSRRDRRGPARGTAPACRACCAAPRRRT